MNSIAIFPPIPKRAPTPAEINIFTHSGHPGGDCTVTLIGGSCCAAACSKRSISQIVSDPLRLQTSVAGQNIANGPACSERQSCHQRNYGMFAIRHHRDHKKNSRKQPPYPINDIAEPVEHFALSANYRSIIGVANLCMADMGHSRLRDKGCQRGRR